MAPVKFIKVVGYSSEDPQFPTENLTSSKGKWKCKEAGEKQAWVILELDQLTSISHLDIGNLGSAFIEVQVGRMGMSAEQYTVLLNSSSFMAPEESRSGSNTTRVRMFSRDKLNQSALEEKWNLVKIVCTQPFNKHVQYGISFLTISGSAEMHKTPVKSPKAAPVKLGAFKMKVDADDDDFGVGTYFKRKKSAEEGEGSSGSASVSAELRSDKTLASLVLEQAKKEDLKRKMSQASNSQEKKKRATDFPRRNVLPGEESVGPDSEEEEKEREKEKEKERKKAEMEKEKQKAKKEKQREREKERERQREKNKEKEKQLLREKVERHKQRDQKKQDKPATASAEERNPPKKKTPSKPRKFAAFDKLLDGVVFTISGFQNPLRGQIRDKALKMGAKYKGDWDVSCTHLVCAFANTPKYNQVKGKGKIVKKEWIEDSFSRRIRLNWKTYSLVRNPPEESDEEIHEKTEESSNGASSSRSERRAHNEDENTDDEIERLMSKNDVEFNENENTDDEIERAVNKKKDKKVDHKKDKDFNEDENTDDEIERALSKNKEKQAKTDFNEDENTDDEIERAMKKTEAKESKKTKGGKVDYHEDEDTDEEIESPKKERKASKSEENTPRKKKEDRSHGGKSTEKKNKRRDSETERERRHDDKENRPKHNGVHSEKKKKHSEPERKIKEEDSDEAYEVDTDKENSDDAYDAETDVDEENIKDLKSRAEEMPLPLMEDIFKGRKFLLKGFAEEENSLLERYITGYGGNVEMYNGPSIKYIITKSASQKDHRDAKKINEDVRIVHPDWIFACCDKLDLVPTNNYKV